MLKLPACLIIGGFKEYDFLNMHAVLMIKLGYVHVYGDSPLSCYLNSIPYHMTP